MNTKVKEILDTKVEPTIINSNQAANIPCPSTRATEHKFNKNDFPFYYDAALKKSFKVKALSSGATEDDTIIKYSNRGGFSINFPSYSDTPPGVIFDNRKRGTCGFRCPEFAVCLYRGTIGPNEAMSEITEIYADDVVVYAKESYNNRIKKSIGIVEYSPEDFMWVIRDTKTKSSVHFNPTIIFSILDNLLNDKTLANTTIEALEKNEESGQDTNMRTDNEYSLIEQSKEAPHVYDKKTHIYLSLDKNKAEEYSGYYFLLYQQKKQIFHLKYENAKELPQFYLLKSLIEALKKLKSPCRTEIVIHSTFLGLNKLINSTQLEEYEKENWKKDAKELPYSNLYKELKVVIDSLKTNIRAESYQFDK